VARECIFCFINEGMRDEEKIEEFSKEKKINYRTERRRKMYSFLSSFFDAINRRDEKERAGKSIREDI
jgi:hypothetical protein